MVSADRNANSRALKGRIALRPAAAARCSQNGSHSGRLPAVLSVCGLRPRVGFPTSSSAAVMATGVERSGTEWRQRSGAG